MTNGHQISPENLASLFVADGNKKLNGAPFTIRSKRSMKDFTFRISQVPFKGYPYLHVKVEKNYMEFTYLGYFRNGNIVRKNKETGVTEVVHTPAAEAISWMLRKLSAKKYSELSDNIQLFHLGKCLKCGKTLTDAVSITAGFGPICINS